MAKYRIEVVASICDTIDVEADSESEAKEMVWDAITVYPASEAGYSLSWDDIRVESIEEIY